MSEANAGQFTPEEQEWVDAFLAETTLFLGPDPEIMNDHRMAPRTAEEDRLLSGPVDANDLDRVRKRIVAGLDEAAFKASRLHQNAVVRSLEIIGEAAGGWARSA